MRMLYFAVHTSQMAAALPLKAALKRGFLITLANWPVVVIEFTIGALFRAALAVPVLAGAVMVAAMIGGDVRALVAEGLRAAADVILATLATSPLALAAFLAAVAIVAFGGVIILYVVKTGTLSVLMAHLIGYRGPALEYMADLGLAMELTSILRTMGNALERGRIYLPLEEIEAFGYSEAEFSRHERNSAFRTLMGFQAERARSYYRRAAPGLELLVRRGRFAVRVAYDLSVSTLNRLEASDFDVFERRQNLPVVERYWITARSLAVPMTKRLWRTMSA